MKLHLEPDAGGWKVIMQVPEKGKNLPIGRLEHKGNLWRLTLAVSERPYHFEAKDLQEAYAHLSEKLQVAEGIPELLRDDTMSTLVFKELQLLNILACNTESLQGWVSGIASGLGRFLLEDLPQGRDDVFWKQLREAAENVREQLREQEVLKGDLETVLKHMRQAIEPDEDPPPTIQ